VSVPEPVDELPITTGDDVVRVRQAVRARASAARLSLVDQTKLITAASELARNTLVHGGSGVARVETVQRDGRPGVKAVFTDDGPGIVDVERRPSPTATPPAAGSGSGWAGRAGSSTSSCWRPRSDRGRRSR